MTQDRSTERQHSEDEYHTMAMLLGYKYQPITHIFVSHTKDSPISIDGYVYTSMTEAIDPDTLEVIYRWDGLA